MCHPGQWGRISPLCLLGKYQHQWACPSPWTPYFLNHHGNQPRRWGGDLVQVEQVHQEDGQDDEGHEGVQVGQEGSWRLPQCVQSLQNCWEGSTRVTIKQFSLKNIPSFFHIQTFCWVHQRYSSTSVSGWCRTVWTLSQAMIQKLRWMKLVPIIGVEITFYDLHIFIIRWITARPGCSFENCQQN